MRLVSRRGFTLVELLVTIGIIALLLAILLPVLSTVRHAARSTQCLATLQQWGASYQTYLSSHHGRSIPQGRAPFNMADGTPLFWWERLRPGVDVSRALLCPEATEPSNAVPDGPLNAWGPEYFWNSRNSVRGPFIGSYGFNGWLYQPENNFPGAIHLPTRQSEQTPVFFDAARWDTWPRDTDAPILHAHGITMGHGGMAMVTVRRHRGGPNVLFLDNHAEYVAPERLWLLHWSEDFRPRTVTFPK